MTRTASSEPFAPTRSGDRTARDRTAVTPFGSRPSQTASFVTTTNAESNVAAAVKRRHSRSPEHSPSWSVANVCPCGRATPNRAASLLSLFLSRSLCVCVCLCVFVYWCAGVVHGVVVLLTASSAIRLDKAGFPMFPMSSMVATCRFKARRIRVLILSRERSEPCFARLDWCLIPCADNGPTAIRNP